MENNLTELIFILDRSGSMAGLEEDTIGGFNSMIEKQKTIEGEVIVSTVLFDNHFEVLHNRVALSSIKLLTQKDYYVRGTTALLDAIGRSISKVQHTHSMLSQDEVPKKIMFVIMTDGMENASTEYRYAQIKTMIENKTKELNWEFIFLGANIDAVNVGARFGMRKDRVANYHADKEGTNLNYEVLSDVVTEYRQTASLKSDWKSRIDKDYTARGKKEK